MGISAIILLGAPGAGKGTIAEGLAAASDYAHVSTGDMLRAAIREGTELGRAAEGFMKQGNLVPDDLIVGMVVERLRRGPAEGRYLFDGFPRTVAQAEMLDRHFGELGAALAGVFLLEAPADVILDRLTGRRVCRQCGAVFHVRNIPPKREGVCDACGGALVQRPDDRRETIETRLEVYRRQTEQLIGYYERRGVLTRVDASQSKEAAIGAIRNALASAAGGAV